MSEPSFTYVTSAEDLATAQLILDETETVVSEGGDACAQASAIARLDRLIVFLEGKVDQPAKPKMVTTLRLRAQLLLAGGKTAEAVANLNEAFELSIKYSDDEAETALIFELLAEHSEEFRKGLAGLSEIAAAIPSGS